jgi:hypothetical protein
VPDKLASVLKLDYVGWRSIFFIKEKQEYFGCRFGIDGEVNTPSRKVAPSG